MLELTRILVEDWTPSEDGSPRRLIRDADTFAPAGFACWQSPGGSWWHHLTPVTLEVHEHADESLLFLLRRRWGLGVSWEVRDADGRATAVLRRDCVEDASESVMALLHWDGAAAEFRGLRGEELGTVMQSERGTLVDFGASQSPFLRMAVLAAALRW